jgi:hypothetical protein
MKNAKQKMQYNLKQYSKIGVVSAKERMLYLRHRKTAAAHASREMRVPLF